MVGEDCSLAAVQTGRLVTGFWVQAAVAGRATSDSARSRTADARGTRPGRMRASLLRRVAVRAVDATPTGQDHGLKNPGSYGAHARPVRGGRTAIISVRGRATTVDSAASGR